MRSKEAALARAAKHEATHEDDKGKTFVTGFRVETGAAPAVFVAVTTIQVGHHIGAVTEERAKAEAAAQAGKLKASAHGADGDESEVKVMRFEVTDE